MWQTLPAEQQRKWKDWLPVTQSTHQHIFTSTVSLLVIRSWISSQVFLLYCADWRYEKLSHEKRKRKSNFQKHFLLSTRQLNVQGYLFVLKHKFIKNWKQQLKQQLQKNKMNIETIISGKQKVTENKKKLSEKQKNKRIKLSNFNQTSFNAHQATWLLVHLSQ